MKIHKTLSSASNRGVGNGGSAQEGGVGGGFSRERMLNLQIEKRGEERGKGWWDTANRKFLRGDRNLAQ